MRTPSEIHRAVSYRAVKLNLPWNSYRVHPSLTQHAATMERPEFWDRLIGFLSDCGFNALTLWSIHPWSFMVRPPSFPEACPFDDRELDRWQSLWRGVFRIGRERGVEIVPVCFNIFVSPELARARGLAPYSADLSCGYNGPGDYSAEVRAYNREIVSEVLRAYPDIGGIGVSQNERMEGVSLEAWQRWIVETYFELAGRYLQDKTFIVRCHTRPTPSLTREAIESYPGRLPDRTLVDVKFNWSHGHATPEFHYMHEGDDGTALREPVPTRYKLVYTVRNEDFFGLDYGSISFMQDLIRANASPRTAGFIIGSECLIPAKEYIVRPRGGPAWDYLYQRQPLFWIGWGTVLADPDADRETVAAKLDALAERHCGGRLADPLTLLEACDLACRTANRVAASIASTWDFTLYSEGLIKGARQDWFGQPFDDTSPLISVSELVHARPLDPEWAPVGAWVDDPTVSGSVTPPDRIAELRRDGTRALELLGRLDATEPASMLDAYERACARAWALLGLCFADRLAAAIACARSRSFAGSLRAARSNYAELCAVLDPWIPQPYELLHLGDNYIRETFRHPMAKFNHRGVLSLMDEELRRLEAR